MHRVIFAVPVACVENVDNYIFTRLINDLPWAGLGINRLDPVETKREHPVDSRGLIC
jgi:hypothetical protein